MGHALAAAGYLVAVPEYRRAGMAEEGWAGTFDDIALAFDQAGSKCTLRMEWETTRASVEITK